MNKFKATGLLMVALIAALGAAIYAGSLSQKGMAISKVVVAAENIKKDSKVTSAMFTVMNWPSASVPVGAVGAIAQIQGKVLKVALSRGEPVLEASFSPKKAGLSGEIAAGMRAMTVKVNEVAGVGGFALPGTHVDVIVNLQPEHDRRSATSMRMSRTVLEHVLVLAAAQESSKDGGKPKPVTSVTLEVSLADAEKLDLARSVGGLSLVLRNPDDRAAVHTSGISRNELFGAAPSAPVAAIVQGRATRARPAAPLTCVEVIRRGATINHCFPQR